MGLTRREINLLQVIHVLWHELRQPTCHPDELDHHIRAQGLGWTIPGPDHLEPDDWLTPDQIAHELGYQTNTIHQWAYRHGLQQVKGRYRWGDIEQLRHPPAS